MGKIAVSKNYFYWVPSKTRKLYDKRVVEKYIKEEDIPPELGLDKNDIKTKIMVYEDRVKTWFLEVGEELKDNNEAGFVILSISIAYIEGNQQFREGKSSNRHSKEFFIRGMRRIFNKENVPERIIGDFYSQVRCGLFHDGMTGNKVLISGDFNDPVRNIRGIIRISPHKFLDIILQDFNSYIKLLKNGDKELIKNFETVWNLKSELNV